MQDANNHLDRCIKEIEAKLGWGGGAQWTHQDFLNLSEKIQEETGEPLSYITLKRIWGKVAYHSLPNSNTLNILAHFLGYDSWRTFQHGPRHEVKSASMILGQTVRPSGKNWKWAWNLVGITVLTLISLAIILSAKGRPGLNPEDFQFSSKKVVSQGIPNSVVFNIDAKRAPYDSVIVQQSWDTRLRTTIPKDQSQHTSIYYFPGYFDAKLVVGEQVVQAHSLHITTDGWYCAVQQESVPVYFPVEEANKEGRLELHPDQLRSRNILLQPRPPLTRMGNCRDFDGLMTDNFIFEAKVRNTYKEGSAVCQNTRIYLLCKGTAIWIPLTAKGCVSSASLNFVNHYASGKKKDLSAFGVDFNHDVQVRMECIQGKASIFLNGNLAYSIEEKIQPVAIKGIDFRFEGLGAIDDVKLGRPGEDWVFQDSFSVNL